MRKFVADGYILGVGDKGDEITQEEYNTILEAINNKPVAPSGHTYKLKESLEWELCEQESGGAYGK